MGDRGQKIALLAALLIASAMPAKAGDDTKKTSEIFYASLGDATRAPIGWVRFHEPCSAMKMPPWYSLGNIFPV